MTSLEQFTNERNRFSPLMNDLPVGLLNRCLDGVNVERTNAAQVDNLSLNSFLGEDVGSLKTVANHLAVCDDGDVRTLALDLSLANGEQEVVGHGLLGHGEGDTVHHLVLEDDNRVGITDSSLRNCGDDEYLLREEADG